MTRVLKATTLVDFGGGVQNALDGHSTLQPGRAAFRTSI